MYVKVVENVTSRGTRVAHGTAWEFQLHKNVAVSLLSLSIEKLDNECQLTFDSFGSKTV